MKIPAAFCYAVDWTPKETARHLILVLHFLWCFFGFVFVLNLAECETPQAVASVIAESEEGFERRG